MAYSPQMPVTDLQWVLGHAHLSITQRYLNPGPTIRRGHQRRGAAPSTCRSSAARPGHDGRRHAAGGTGRGPAAGDEIGESTGVQLVAAFRRRRSPRHGQSP
ncbi:hypothetical protein [Mycobacterium pseudokansasii]|uniref:hypothetical protein n=1 Tax=Mycobacterium pseudokansasii TaxID=2341080 RepID=UPI0009BDCC3A